MGKLEFKGTKTPWEARGNFVYIENEVCQIASVITHKGNIWESQANAKLIASAPDLLEALQEIVKQNELRGYADSEDSIKAKQAIEKALK